MRITGGAARGIQLSAPKGGATRPATDQMREALFSSLGSHIEGARVADLFAGTGAYGLEAMSRGAVSGMFIESSSTVVACLKKNLSAVSKSCEATPTQWRVLNQSIQTIPQSLGTFDIVFMDPPYEMIETKVPDIFRQHVAPLLSPEGRLYMEMPGHLDVALDGWAATRRLGKPRKDKPTVVLYQRS